MQVDLFYMKPAAGSVINVEVPQQELPLTLGEQELPQPQTLTQKE